MAGHYQILNPAVLDATTAALAQSCTVRNDAPVCKDGNTDVTCDTETYRGCDDNETDCANCATSNDNQDDVCCAGTSNHGVGDNVDHRNCHHNDAEWDGYADAWCIFFWWNDSNPPVY